MIKFKILNKISAFLTFILLLNLPSSLALSYGEINEGGSDRFTYNSKEEDSTGLMYYGARYYKPDIPKQFIQPDQLIQDPYNPQSLNRYSYVLNNPYKYVDESGNVAFLAPVLIGAGIGGAISASVSIVSQYSQTGAVNWADVGKSAGVGAVAGATAAFGGVGAGALLGGGTAGAIGGGAVAGLAGGEVGAFGSSLIQGTDYSFDPTRAATNTILGGVIGGASYKISGAITASKVNFVNKQSLSQHFEKHKTEFGGFTSEKQYLQAAQKFIGSKGGNIESYTRNNGEMVMVNKVTGEFGIITKDGAIKTYFDPGKGNPTKSYGYFLRDKQISGVKE